MPLIQALAANYLTLKMYIQSALKSTINILKRQRSKYSLKTLLFSCLCFASVTAFAAQPTPSAAPGVPAAPAIEAGAYILLDFNSGATLLSLKADERMEPASLTKLMTAYVVFEELKASRLKLEDQITISEKAWRAPGSRTFIEVGKTVPAQELLLGMIVQSGNDATIALAEQIAGSEEILATMMNQRAKALGMKGTNFINSTGLPDPNHYTTARDLAILARAVIGKFPEYYRWYSVKEHSFNGITQFNRNLLLWRDKSVDGVKTGHTESAGFCLVASASRDSMRLISIVLGAKSEAGRADESQKLLNFGFRFYETHQLYKANEPLTQVRVWKGESQNIPAGLKDPLIVTIPRGRYNDLKATMNMQAKVLAPIDTGHQLGTVNVSLDGKQLAQRQLIALQNTPQSGFIDRMLDEVMLMFQ